VRLCLRLFLPGCGTNFLISHLIVGGRKKIDETSRKKKQLNEAEIALRREETARKRKHLSEKKLEDEKVRISFSLTTTALPPYARPYARRRRSTVC
jgi:predicted RNA polymerase sigma factor